MVEVQHDCCLAVKAKGGNELPVRLSLGGGYAKWYTPCFPASGEGTAQTGIRYTFRGVFRRVFDSCTGGNPDQPPQSEFLIGRLDYLHNRAVAVLVSQRRTPLVNQQESMPFYLSVKNNA
jgi:hypothetical protein